MYYRRRLPHWQPSEKDLFITWSLHGALPHNRFPPPKALTAGQAFVWMDRFLDEARHGPTWLRRDDVAKVVVDALQYGADCLRHYDLYAFVIMSNHVHALVRPHTTTSRLLHSIKGFSAREANKLLGRSGEPFWQSESYDHWVRDDTEFRRIRGYIENNPARAGMVGKADEYRWSSAYAGTNAGVAG